jgi:ribonuclease BN (tRNA processing enzyme)
MGEYHEAALTLAAGADVLIHDAFLLPEEVPTQARFGHAAADYAVGLAAMAGARRVVLFHHRPDRTDTELDKLAGRLADAPVPVVVAAEREVLTL